MKKRSFCKDSCIVLYVIFLFYGCPNSQVEINKEDLDHNYINPDQTLKQKPPDTPILYSGDAFTYETSFIIRGSAESWVNIVVIGGLEEKRGSALADGSFSIEVPLILNSVNHLLVYAERDGLMSLPASINITQKIKSGSSKRPDTPILDPYENETGSRQVTLSGHCENGLAIEVEGTPYPAHSSCSLEDGRFTVGVALHYNQLNTLRIFAVDEYGNRSLPAIAQIRQIPSDKTGTIFPVILVHGFMGFSEIMSVEYFYHVKEYLESYGYEVYTPALSAVNSIEYRATELKEQIRQITSGPVNIIAHSMGGLDSRYLICKLGMEKMVKSLVTISTPHRGTSVADFAISSTGQLGIDAANLLFGRLGLNFVAVQQLTTDYVENTFNPSCPDSPDVDYISFAGYADPLGLSGNPMDPLFESTYIILKSNEGINDGMVSVRSAKWGEFRRKIHADHIDEVGHFAGDTDGFDYLNFYLEIATLLKSRGY